MIQRLILRHPHSIGETYLQHQRVALSFALPLFAAACACLVHALLPGLFERTASGIVERLHRRMALRGGPASEGLVEAGTPPAWVGGGI